MTCKVLRGEQENWAHVVFLAMKIRSIYTSSVPMYLQILIVPFLKGRKDLLSRSLETKDGTS